MTLGTIGAKNRSPTIDRKALQLGILTDCRKIDAREESEPLRHAPSETAAEVRAALCFELVALDVIQVKRGEAAVNPDLGSNGAIILA